MDKNDRYRSLRAAAWITQLGLNMVTPMLLSVIAALWLKKKFDLGDWIMFAAIAVGVLGLVGSMLSFIKTVKKGGGPGDKKDSD